MPHTNNETIHLLINTNWEITCQQENLLAIIPFQMQIVQRKHASIHALTISRYPTLVQTSLGRWLNHPLLGLSNDVTFNFVGISCGRLFRICRSDWRNGHCVRCRAIGGCSGVVVARCVECCGHRCRCGVLAKSRNIAARSKVHAMMKYGACTGSGGCCCCFGEPFNRWALLVFGASVKGCVVVVVLGRGG